MIVVDASAVVSALVDDGASGAAARTTLSRDPHWVAPDHLVVEVVSAVRGLLLGGKLGAGRADEAVAALGTFEIELVPLGPVLDAVWRMRDVLSAYDAAYVAWASELRCTLVTGDRRLARSAGLRCDTTVV